MSNKAFRVSEEWLEKVDKVVDKPEKVTTGKAPTSSRFYDVRPVRQRSSSWTYENGEYSAEFAPLINNKPDNTNVIKVYAPTASAAPNTGIGAKYFAAWRGRWEIVDVPRKTVITVGSGLSVTENAGYNLTNTGILSVKVFGETYETQTVMFASGDFTWSSPDDYVGKEVCIKKHDQQIVEDVKLVNGELQVTYKTIAVIG